MVDIDISDAVREPETWKPFAYEGTPDFDELTFTAPVLLTAQYGSFDDTIRVKGNLRASLAASCTRCLRDTTCRIEAGFDEVFVPSAGSGDCYSYNRETKRVSLDQMIYDLLQTETPMRVLCSDSCKGLCPVCGEDLNNGPCGCCSGDNNGPEDVVRPDNPFAKLKDVL